MPRPRRGSSNLALPLTALILLGACASGAIDLAPVARVGDDTVSRAFLETTIRKLGIKDPSPEQKKEILDTIIENALLAARAAGESADDTAAFNERRRNIVTNARRESLCALRNVSEEECPTALFEELRRVAQLRVDPIDWERVFVRRQQAFIPFGGKLPSGDGGSTSASGRIDAAYAKSRMIRSVAGETSLYGLLASISEDLVTDLADADRGGRERILRLIILDANLEQLMARLEPAQRAFVAEVEQRSIQAALAVDYKKKLGFVDLGSGTAPAVIYPVSEAEARAFYMKYPALFEEPLWIEASHIRFGDYDTATRVRNALLRDPGAFCAAAARYSIAPDAKQCGALGIVRRARTLPLYKEFGFTLTRPGQISIPFQTPDGVEVLLLHRRGVRTRPFGDLYTRTLIVEKMQPLKRDERLRRVLAEQKARTPVSYFRLK